jgi:hypothetical protein
MFYTQIFAGVYKMNAQRPDNLLRGSNLTLLVLQDRRMAANKTNTQFGAEQETRANDPVYALF